METTKQSVQDAVPNIFCYSLALSVSSSSFPSNGKEGSCLRDWEGISFSSRCQFHHCFMCNFYARISQKRKNDSQVIPHFCAFVIYKCKSCVLTCWWNWPHRYRPYIDYDTFAQFARFHFWKRKNFIETSKWLSRKNVQKDKKILIF